MCDTSAPRGAADRYVPRDVVRTVLYDVVSRSLETFLARARDRDRVVPRFVEREFRDYLACGIAAHGFLRVHCDACGFDRIVPFSCYPQRETIWSVLLRGGWGAA